MKTKTNSFLNLLRFVFFVASYILVFKDITIHPPYESINKHSKAHLNILKNLSMKGILCYSNLFIKKKIVQPRTKYSNFKK